MEVEGYASLGDMKTLLYIAILIIFFAGGIIVGMLIDKDNVYNAQIRKIKQRGKGNVLKSIFDPILTPDTKPGDVSERKQRRIERRAKRKARRLIKK